MSALARLGAVGRRALRVGWRPGRVYRLPTRVGTVPYRVVRADRGTPTNDAPVLVVGLHGYGSDEAQLATLVGLDLPWPAIYLAPRAAHADGEGYSWFDIEVGPNGRPRPGDIRPALARVHAFADAAQAAWGTRGSVLVGYSQGGALTLAAATVDQGRFDAFAVVAGGVVELPTDAVAGVSLFLAVGTLDPAVPATEMRETADALTQAGMDLTYHESAAPHVVTSEQRVALSGWLGTLTLPL